MITQVKIYADDNTSEYATDLIRCEKVISEDDKGNETEHQDLIDKYDFHSSKELIQYVSDRLSIDPSICKIISYKILVNAISGFDRIFLNNTTSSLKSFLNIHKKVKGWIITSDYCIKDKNKKNRIACFTIIPYIAPLDMIINTIKRLAPKDIKKTRKISNEFINFLRSGVVYNVCINLQKFNAVISSQGEAENHLNDIISMYRSFIRSTEKNTVYFEGVIRDVKMLKEEIKKKSFNQKLLNHILFISFMAAYLARTIVQETDAETLSWFPDRDDITDSYNKLACNLFHAQCYTLCNYSDLDISNKTIGIGLQTDNDLWFDPLIRIPDYIAGSFADWDYKTNEVSDKHLPMIESFAADNPFLAVFEYGLEKDAENDSDDNCKVYFTKNHLKIIKIQKKQSH